MITLFANPYDPSATGFYFETAEEYAEKAAKFRNSHGQPVEEFEIEFIDGDKLDCALFSAWKPHQGNFPAYLDACEDWDEGEKLRFIIAVGECGYSFDPGKDHPGDFDLDLYDCPTLRELAEQFVDDGLYGDIPETLQNYIDYDAIARDLGFDYTETTIAGQSVIYRCG